VFRTLIHGIWFCLENLKTTGTSYRSKWENNIKMNFKEMDGKQWIGFIYLKIRSSGGCCEFGDEIPPFIKCCKFFTSRAAVSFSGNVLFRVVSEPL